MTSKILVTGGTGSTGTALTARLREAGVPFRIASRRPASNADAEQVRFDWEDETTYGPALEGAEKVYLVAPAFITDPERLMVPFLHRATDAGVRRAVLLSSSAISEGGPLLGKVHEVVHKLMPQWSVLQPSWFMQNFVNALGPAIRADGEIVTATGDGRVGFVDVGDIVEVAFRALTDLEPHNRAHVITGPQALSYADAAATIAEAAQRPVRHLSIRTEQLQERLTAFGMPAPYAALLAGLDEGIKNGSEDRVTPTVEDVTGRRPKSFAELARGNAGAWRQPG